METDWLPDLTELLSPLCAQNPVLSWILLNVPFLMVYFLKYWSQVFL